MKIVMTLLVRDEDDIVAANVEHHLDAGVDHVIATDNGSADRTVAILERYAASGALTLLHEPGDDYSQARWVTRMARSAAVDHGADWVINNDADEFWWVPDHDLHRFFGQVPDDVGAVSVPRANFVARPDDDRPFWERMTVRQQPATPHPGIDWPTLGPKAAHRARADIEVAQGNHGVSRADGVPVTVAEADGMEILHFPVRSGPRFENKIVLGGAAYARNSELPEEVGKIWRDLYAVHQAGEFGSAYRRCLLSDDELRRGLADGSLVEDHRLARRLADLGVGRTVAP